MNDNYVIATIVDNSPLTMEQLAHLCRVETAWLQYHVEEGLFPQAENMNGTWLFTQQCVSRVQRMYWIEQGFDAVPELAALMADMQDEMDSLRRQLQALGKIA